MPNGRDGVDGQFAEVPLREQTGSDAVRPFLPVIVYWLFQPASCARSTIRSLANFLCQESGIN